MTISIFKDNGILNVRAEGRLDSVTSPDFEKAVKKEFKEDVKTIALNFEKVDYISSSGLRVLVSLSKELHGGDIRIIKPNKMVVEVLKLSSLIKLFKIETGC